MTTLEVRATWDDAAQVWYAVSDEVPGLCVEARTLDELIDIATALTPELLEANRMTPVDPVQLHITAERTTLAKAA